MSSNDPVKLFQHADFDYLPELVSILERVSDGTLLAKDVDSEAGKIRNSIGRARQSLELIAPRDSTSDSVQDQKFKIAMLQFKISQKRLLLAKIAARAKEILESPSAPIEDPPSIDLSSSAENMTVLAEESELQPTFTPPVVDTVNTDLENMHNTQTQDLAKDTDPLRETQSGEKLQITTDNVTSVITATTAEESVERVTELSPLGMALDLQSDKAQSFGDTKDQAIGENVLPIDTAMEDWSTPSGDTYMLNYNDIQLPEQDIQQELDEQAKVEDLGDYPNAIGNKTIETDGTSENTTALPDSNIDEATKTQ
ncbi:uncharacterized protein V1516DRAFT_663516 [Lipomyces oligophaga]|uniref:uncharacterized protein n=1 Tax=Lipomyces oligophaga TaxID=45792 RepID=UPI0034CE89E7